MESGELPLVAVFHRIVLRRTKFARYARFLAAINTRCPEQAITIAGIANLAGNDGAAMRLRAPGRLRRADSDPRKDHRPDGGEWPVSGLLARRPTPSAPGHRAVRGQPAAAATPPAATRERRGAVRARHRRQMPYRRPWSRLGAAAPMSIGRSLVAVELTTNGIHASPRSRSCSTQCKGDPMSLRRPRVRRRAVLRSDPRERRVHSPLQETVPAEVALYPAPPAGSSSRYRWRSSCRGR